MTQVSSQAASRAALALSAYYLARFDKVGYQILGYASWGAAFEDIGLRLGVAAATVKNRRDEFDVLFPWRQGWHGFALPTAVIQLSQQLAELDEPSIRRLVSQGLHDQGSPEVSLIASIAEQAAPFILETDGSIPPSQPQTRALTGAAAEELFMELHAAGRTSFVGQLHDHRLHMGGYDFLIESADGVSQYVEIKGLLAERGGLSLTSKEYRTATEKGNAYWLVLISRLISGQPVMQIINSPASSLQLTPRLHVVVQQSWQASAAQVNTIPIHEY